MILLALWIVGTIIYLPLAILLDNFPGFRLLIMNIWACGVCYAYCFIATYWVIWQYKKQLKQFEVDGGIKKMSLEELLLSKDGFDLFATHLVNEFSIENLAFIFEVMRIKKEAIKHRFAPLSVYIVGNIVRCNNVVFQQ